MANLLSSESSIYYMERLLGQGSYGKVVKCTRMTDMKTVAIKMLKNDEYHKRAADLEVYALMKLRSLDPDNCNIVRWYNVFNDKEHVCLEFEHLDKCLKGFMRDRNFQPLSLKEIRPIAQQLSTALYHLKTVGLIHADLKLENVMLVNHVREPYRVKLIDFGLAREDAKVCSYIQSRPYRSPEIILGLPFSEAIDMWSLGCMTASLYLGTTLYPGDSEYDMIRYMVETQGPIPDNLLRRGRRTRHFYQRNDQSTTSHWNLKTPEQYQQEKGIQALENRRVKMTSLDDLLHIRATNDGRSVDNAAEKEDLLMFVDMIKGMLQFDAAKRITPRQALMHPFVTMEHMSSIYSHIKSCFQQMSVCQRPLAPSNTETVGGSLQQPFHRTAQLFHPVCPQPPPPPPCPPSLPHHPSPPLCPPPPLGPCPRSRPSPLSHLTLPRPPPRPCPPPLSPPPPPRPPSAERSSLSQLRLEKRADDESVNKTGNSKTHQKWRRHDTEKALKPHRPTAPECSRNIQGSTAVRQDIKRRTADDDVRRQPSNSNQWNRFSKEERDNRYWSSLTQSFVPRNRNNQNDHFHHGQKKDNEAGNMDRTSHMHLKGWRHSTVMPTYTNDRKSSAAPANLYKPRLQEEHGHQALKERRQARVGFAAPANTQTVLPIVCYL